MAEAFRAAFARFEMVHHEETGLLHPADHQLGDPVSTVDLIRRHGICVHKYDRDLTPVTRVNQAGRVQASDPVVGCQPASRQYEAGVAVGDLEGDPGSNCRPPTARGEQRVDPGNQVATGVAEPCIARRQKVRIEAEQWDLEHDSAP